MGNPTKALSQVVEVTKQETERNDEDEADEDPAEEFDPPRSRYRRMGFYRFPTNWQGEDRIVVSRAQQAIDDRVQTAFADAFQIMHDIFIIVREKEVDRETGEIKVDQNGWPIWARTPSGGFVEDWAKLTRKQREDFLFQITTRLFAWEQRAAQMWTEAMFAKSKWEESFAAGYVAPMSGTIDDRTAAGRMDAAQDRYFAVFLTAVSKRGDGIVRSMTLLAQRIKDVLET